MTEVRTFMTEVRTFMTEVRTFMTKVHSWRRYIHGVGAFMTKSFKKANGRLLKDRHDAGGQFLRCAKISYDLAIQENTPDARNAFW